MCMHEELEVSKKQAETDKKKIEELTRERDLLSKVITTNTHFLVGNALAQVIPSICTHFFVVWSVICHICAPCLNHLMYLHVI